MIQTQTKLYVMDNSGAKQVRCIKVLGSSKKRYAFIGDIIKVSVINVQPQSKIKKGTIYSALVVKTKKNLIRRSTGMTIKFSKNSVVLLGDKNQLIGSRIFGVVPNELRISFFSKLISLAKDII